MNLFQFSPYKWVFALAEEKDNSLVFSLPWKQLLLLALVTGAIGFMLLHPMVDGVINQSVRLVAIGISFVLAALLCITVMASHGELRIEGNSRVVRLRLHTPWQQRAWIKPFHEFECIRFYQVVDGHGLHNHWRIELVLKDGTQISLGYGLIGTFRRSSADYLTARLSTLMGIPIRQAENKW